MMEIISKILIVEDDYKLASEWQDELIEKGFIVDVAANSREAELLLGNKYNCFIIDLFHVKDSVFLPDGGIHFISQIRRYEAQFGYKSLIITVTGYYRERGNLRVSTGEISELLGADITYVKPLKFSTIFNAIENHNTLVDK